MTVTGVVANAVQRLEALVLKPKGLLIAFAKSVATLKHNEVWRLAFPAASTVLYCPLPCAVTEALDANVTCQECTLSF